MKKLRIATMVTGYHTTPPPKGLIYAPMDIAIWISEGLIKRGHKVDFYATKGSKINVTRVINNELQPLDRGDNRRYKILKGLDVGNVEKHKILNLWDQYLIAQMFKQAEKGKYDILHIHPADRALPLALSHSKVPTVYTLHDPIYPWRAEIFRMFSSPNQYYVSLSNAQRKPAPDLNYLATIYNGINIDIFPFSLEHDDYLLFVGRLHSKKGVAEAVEVARRTGEKLLIIGPPETGDYWKKQVAPYLNEKIKYLGYVPYKKLYQYYQKAKATLVPIQWEEPFGLVITESMACGTPVLAFRRGSVPEIVVNDKNGFIVNTVDQMVAAIKKIEQIDRKDCRAHVEEKFAIEHMVDRYEEEFLNLVV